jgi:putative pyruvate formate lyase activating enzyme
MHRQVGDLHLTTEGIAKYGLIVRHLIMPDGLDEAKHILQWLANEVSQDTYVNIMEQYRPQYLVGDCTRDGKGKRFAEIDRAITTGEKEQVYEYARAVGLHRFAIDDGNVCRSTV